jgi:general secretion pathway protein G
VVSDSTSKLSVGPLVKRQVWFISAMVVLLAVLAGGIFYLRYSMRRGRETTLKQDLQTMRRAIDNYTLDKQRAPQSLQDLLTGHYLKEIPTDPFTRHEDWVLHFGDTVLNPDQTATGLDDVHSASGQVGRDGTPYNSW